MTKEPQGGATVTSPYPCVCGMAPEEHGHDPKHPSWTGCAESGCDAYEADEAIEPEEGS